MFTVVSWRRHKFRMRIDLGWKTPISSPQELRSTLNIERGHHTLLQWLTMLRSYIKSILHQISHLKLKPQNTTARSQTHLLLFQYSRGVDEIPNQLNHYHCHSYFLNSNFQVYLIIFHLLEHNRVPKWILVSKTLPVLQTTAVQDCQVVRPAVKQLWLRD